MCARNVVDLLDDNCASSQGELELKLNNLPLIGALLYSWIFFQEAFFLAGHDVNCYSK